MEIKAELLKPYTEQQKINFIVENNHNKGFLIEETETKLIAKGFTQEEKLANEKEVLSKICLTAADVERALYKAKNIDFDDIISMVSSNPPENLDIKALKIELKANNFYRGNPYISQIGKLLDITEEQLDEFFKTNDYTKLQ